MAKEEAKEKVAKVVFERNEVVKALEEKRKDQGVREMTIREEAIEDILKFGMTFRRSALFMIKEKIP